MTAVLSGTFFYFVLTVLAGGPRGPRAYWNMGYHRVRIALVGLLPATMGVAFWVHDPTVRTAADRASLIGLSAVGFAFFYAPWFMYRKRTSWRTPGPRHRASPPK